MEQSSLYPELSTLDKDKLQELQVAIEHREDCPELQKEVNQLLPKTKKKATLKGKSTNS